MSSWRVCHGGRQQCARDAAARSSDSGAGDGNAGDGHGAGGPDAGPVADGSPVDGDSHRGVIVLSGTVTDDAGAQRQVLAGLDPTHGQELAHARVSMTVSALAYDGARDLWYVFEDAGGHVFPQAADPFYLHTRTLDAATGDCGHRERGVGRSASGTPTVEAPIQGGTYAGPFAAGTTSGFGAATVQGASEALGGDAGQHVRWGGARPAQGNNYALTAFHLAAGAAPVLVQRQAPDWTTPDLVPQFVATRAPSPAACAPP